MLKNAGTGLAALLFSALSLLLLFFVILSAVSTVSPFGRTYFLRADTNGITGARDVTQWTYFWMCGLDNRDCGGASAAPPFGSAWSANPENAPAALVGSNGGNTTSSRYFYMWRFGWVFLLMALFFQVVAFFSGFLACCGRLGSAISLLVSAIALFFYAIAIALTTAVFTMARNQFTSNNRDARLGTYAFGFLWGSFVSLFISCILFGLGTRGDRSSSRSVRSSRPGYRFWRRRSGRSRSFEGRRVKDDYS